MFRQERLKLTSVCSKNPDETRRWRVRNPNNIDIEFTWDLVGTNQRGSGIAKAEADTFFETITVPGPNTLRIFVNGVLQSTKASGGEKCPEPKAPTTTRGLEVFEKA